MGGARGLWSRSNAPVERERCLIHDTRQLDGLRDRLNRGARNASEHLENGIATAAMKVEVVSLSCLPLGSLSPEALCGDGDRVAAVSCALHGSLSGAAVFAMEPEDAFAWVMLNGTGTDPLESFVASGQRVLRELVCSTGQTEPLPELGVAVLREETLMEILVGTHAPSDTLVLSALLELHAEGLCLPGSFHLLVAPKLFGHLGGESLPSEDAAREDAAGE
jgi:hypothetical protein